VHYSNLVIVEKPDDHDIKKAVAEVMSPHENHWWDWYQIGGRWTGVFDGYDPAKDPANQQDGRAKWPTEWAEHPGDIVPLESVSEESYKKFFRVVIGRRTFGGEDYLPWKKIEEMFPRREMPPLEWLKNEYAGHLAVVVDNHDGI